MHCLLSSEGTGQDSSSLSFVATRIRRHQHLSGISTMKGIERKRLEVPKLGMIHLIGISVENIKDENQRGHLCPVLFN